jgi:hypothetical protein
MSKHDTVLQVETEARKVLGDRASEWMRKPSKLLDGMAPAELANSSDGARVVLLELDRAKTPLRAAAGSAAPNSTRRLATRAPRRAGRIPFTP